MEKLLTTVLLAFALLVVVGAAARARQHRPSLPAEVAVPAPRPASEKDTVAYRVWRDGEKKPITHGSVYCQ